MKIAAITKYKHGELYLQLRKHGWSQSELARRSGLRLHTIASAINLTHRPSENTINQIQKAFAEVGEVLDVASMFPDAYIGTGERFHHVQVAEIEPMRLQDIVGHERLLLENAQMPVADRLLDSEEALSAFDAVLSPIERDVMRDHFVEGLTYAEIGKLHHRSIETIRLHVVRSLRKIRDYLKPKPKAEQPVKLYLWEDGISRPEPPK